MHSALRMFYGSEFGPFAHLSFAHLMSVSLLMVYPIR
jgi:hypothetical protein